MTIGGNCNSQVAPVLYYAKSIFKAPAHLVIVVANQFMANSRSPLRQCLVDATSHKIVVSIYFLQGGKPYNF